jgi:hypothetical protein
MSNNNGALLDPRKANVIAYYQNPTSETFGNLTQSMKKAGYGDAYIKNVTKSKLKWLNENTQRTVEMITASEDTLNHYTSLKINLNKKLDKGEIEKAKLKLDASKFILKTLARQKYTEDKEKEKQNININITRYGDDEIKEAEVVNDLDSSSEV